MTRRTIIYTGAFELPDKNAAAQRVVANAMILKNLGYNVVLVGESRQLNGDIAIRRTNFEDLSFEVWERPYPQGSFQWMLRTISASATINMIRECHAEALHSIICYNFPAFAQLSLAKYARRNGAFGIADITEWYGSTKIDSVSSVAKNLDNLGRMRLVNYRMDGIISTSPFITEFYGNSDRPIVELPTLFFQKVEPEPFIDADARRPKRLFFAGTGFNPQAVKRSKDGPKDRLDKVIEALSVADRLGARFRFDVFGVGKEDYIDIFPDHVAILARLGENVAFHGRVAQASVRECLATADFSIFFRDRTVSNLAGFPTKYSESIHYGTPVITNKLGALVGYHQDGATGFIVDYESAERAGQQIAEALSLSVDRIASMKEFCRQSGLFDFRRYEHKMEDFLGRLTR